ncbi:MAG: DUF533 domain-containing protein [Vicinamibacterales bacterium]
MNDPTQLLSLFLRGVLGRSGRKRARRAARYVSGQRGLLTASGVLAAAGVAWGVYDSLKGTAGASGGPAASVAAGAPPPIPMPPLPAAATPGGSGLPMDVLRIVRLAVSAARADGVLAPAERELILEQARRAGVDAEVEHELANPHKLADIVAGVTDDQARRDLYALAFAIVRADESVSGAERIYLAQLAHQLGLDAATTARLEADTESGIDTAPDTDDDGAADGAGVPDVPGAGR